jgi:hypothetical protein
MGVVNKRTRIGVGLKFGLDEVPERDDVKVRARMVRLGDGELKNGMSGSCRTHGSDWKRLQCFR